MKKDCCKECAKIFCMYRGKREYCTEIIKLIEMKKDKEENK